MPTCQNCSKTFKNRVEVEGKIRNFQRRKFCLDCSPFGKHNTSSVLDRDERVKLRRRKWVELVTEWRRRRKQSLIKYKGGKCKKCGYDKSVPGAYAFHHRDPSKKEIAIASSSFSFERLKANSIASVSFIS